MGVKKLSQQYKVQSNQRNEATKKEEIKKRNLECYGQWQIEITQKKLPLFPNQTETWTIKKQKINVLSHQTG